MEVWIVLRDWEEDIDEYGTHHNDEFCGVFVSEVAASAFVEQQPNRNWETNNYTVQRRDVQS